MKLYIKSGLVQTAVVVPDGTDLQEAAMLGIRKWILDQIGKGGITFRMGGMLKIGERGFDVSEGDSFLWSCEILEEVNKTMEPSSLRDNIEKMAEELSEMKNEIFTDMLGRLGPEVIKNYY